MRQGPSLRSVSVAIAVLATAALAGPDWEEMGDAGPLPNSSNPAQVPIGSGALQVIAGNLSAGFGNPDYEDMYLIYISDPLNFMATTNLVSDFDTQLFLFDMYGRALLGNDDISAENHRSRLTNAADDNTEVMLTEPGLYYLAISGYNNDPVSVNGPMFNQALRTEISGPDGVGGGPENEISGWSGAGDVGSYVISMEGVRFAPEPGVVALLAVAGIEFARRRKRT